MIYKRNNNEYKTPVNGVEQKTLVYGENTLMTEFRLKKGAEIPPHKHPHEQTGYLVSGKIRMRIDSETYECEPGDGWCIPGNVLHGAGAEKDSIAVEVFSPVRKDYLPNR